MNKTKIIVGGLAGVATFYFFVEAAGLVEPKQYHVEIGTTQPSEINNIAFHSPLTTTSGSAPTVSFTQPINFGI